MRRYIGASNGVAGQLEDGRVAPCTYAGWLGVVGEIGGGLGIPESLGTLEFL